MLEAEAIGVEAVDEIAASTSLILTHFCLKIPASWIRNAQITT